MFYLISVLLKEADLIFEADPIHDILEVWKRFGLPSAVILNHANMQDIAQYLSEATAKQFSYDEAGGAAPLLFEVPQRGSELPTPVATSDGKNHRMLLSIVDSSSIQVEELLDATEETLQARVSAGEDLIFVFPIAHVRGLRVPNHSDE